MRRKVSDTDIVWLHLSLADKVYSPEEWGSDHLLIPVLLHPFFLIGIHLMQQRLLIIVILIAILVHLRIILPVILVHVFNLLLAFCKRPVDFFKPGFYFFCHVR